MDLQIQPGDPAFLYLNELGYSEQRLATMNKSTRLYHDLGLYGDNAIDDMSFLQTKFGVDLSEFDFDSYFPPEFEGRNGIEAFLLSLIPFSGLMMRRRRTYLPITLEMIDQSIRAGRWTEVLPIGSPLKR